MYSLPNNHAGIRDVVSMPGYCLQHWPDIETKEHLAIAQRFLKRGTWHISSEWIFHYVAICIIMAVSRQKESLSRDYALLLSNDLRLYYSAQYHRKHARRLNSLEHCISTTSMTNIRPYRDSNWVSLSFEPLPDWMSHRDRPAHCRDFDFHASHACFPGSNSAVSTLRTWVF